MATVYFLYRSTRKNAPLTARVQAFDENNKKFQFEGKTEVFVTKQFWDNTRHKKRNVDAVDKKVISEVNKKLSELESFIITEFYEEKPDSGNKNWLKEKLHDYYNPKRKDIEKEQNELITYWIQRIINTADTRENSKGGLGLSTSRIKSYQNLLNLFKKFQGKKEYRIKDVDLNFGRKFLHWLLITENYSEGYSKKKVDDLKAVCLEAELNGIEVNLQLKKVKGGKAKNENILYLSAQELKLITEYPLENTSLENVRKWLLLGCNLGQRGNDLLNLTEANFVTRNGLEIIELKQQKTGKNVTIPVLPTTKEILKEGLPLKIPIQKFNNKLKDLCELVGIKEKIKGTKVTMVDEKGNEIPKDKKGKYIKQGKKRKITGTFPKYELISSHVCRRSFATNLYGTLPTPLIMQITAHSSEKMLLGYIGKSAMDYAQQIADYYERQAN